MRTASSSHVPSSPKDLQAEQFLVQKKLLAWADSGLKKLLITESRVEALPGDAGFRQYYRLNTQPPLLAVYAPPKVEKNKEFVAIAQYWRALGVSTPKVLAVDYEQGFLLLEDFGPDSFADTIEYHKKQSKNDNFDVFNSLYRPVLSELNTLQCAEGHAMFGLYDECELQREMDLFPIWFLEKLLGYPVAESDSQRLLAEANSWIIQQCIAQPNVMVHRDYHCRNIQVGNGGNIGLIDFQDAIIGPVTYDLASLLKDCYQQWPASWVEKMAKNYRRKLPSHLQMLDDESFLQGFDAMGLQRHLKVLGIFARLHIRDSKSRYLDDLPLVIAYVRHSVSKYPALQAFGAWFEHNIMPLVEKQPWFCSVEIKP